MGIDSVRLQERAARVVALLLGLLFAAGVVSKLFDWEATREAMTVYTIISWLPPALPAVGSLIVEIFVAVTMILTPTWRKYGLPSAAVFLAGTGVLLGIETMAGGGGDCGCIPFIPRDISWMAAGQNLAAALFLFSLWRYLEVGEAEAAPSATAEMSPGDS